MDAVSDMETMKLLQQRFADGDNHLGSSHDKNACAAEQRVSLHHDVDVRSGGCDD